MPHSLERLSAYMSLMFLMAFGVAGASVLALFLCDMVIALLSRTVPQMNVLILGFQVKTIVLLLTLPLAFGMGGLGAAILGEIADWTSIGYIYKICSFLPLIGLVTWFLPNIEGSRSKAKAST